MKREYPQTIDECLRKVDVELSRYGVSEEKKSNMIDEIRGINVLRTCNPPFIAIALIVRDSNIGVESTKLAMSKAARRLVEDRFSLNQFTEMHALQLICYIDLLDKNRMYENDR